MSGQMVGQVIGSYFGPIGSFIGGMIGSALFPDKGAESAVDTRPQTSEYGQPLPLVYGTATPKITVIWASEFEVEAGGGGKGGGAEDGATAYANFAVAICEADGDVQLGHIWAGPDKRLLWDGVQLDGGGTVRFYDGASDQLPDALIESFEGVGNVPAYRGTAYVVFEGMSLLKDGNRLPYLTIEIGRINAEANTAPEFLGSIFISQIIVSSAYMMVFYNGGYDGVVIRDLAWVPPAGDLPSGNLLVDHYTYPSADWSLSPVWFFDEARQVIVQWRPVGLFYATISLATGIRTIRSITAAVGAVDTNFGTELFGGAMHNGSYVFAARGSSVVSDRVTLFVMNPDTHTATATYAANTGAGVGHTLMKPIDASAHLYVATATAVTKHALTSSTAAVSMGAVASSQAQVDPNTGLIWSISRVSGILTVHVNSPVTNSLVYSTSFPFPPLANEPFCFVPAGGIEPNQLIIIGQQFVGTDAFAIFDADAPAATSQVVGGYHGTAKIEAMAWNPVAQQLFAVRKSGTITYSDPLDARNPLTVNLFQPGTLIGEEDNKYLGEADYGGGFNPPAGQLLSEIVSDLCLRAGLTTGQIDVTQLTDIVDGYTISSQTPVRDAILALMPAYFFDAVESEGKIKFVKRGGAIAVVIPNDDVGSFVAGGEPPEALETKRRMENELPRTMNVRYVSQATDYSPAAKAAKRLVGASGEEETMDMPLVLTDTKAQEIAEVNLHGAWVARITYSFTLPRKYSYLEPTDIIVVYGYTMRLTKTVQDDGIIKCEATHDDSNIYVPNVIVTETPPIDHGGGVTLTSETILELA